MKKVMTILGTRPEIIKLSPIIPLLEQSFEHILVHTGQHYDYEMDKVFFDELKLPAPTYNLKVGSCEPAVQIALIMEKLDEIITKEKPDMIIVQGDTNSTLAGALTAVKKNIPLIHIEAGCRSFDKKQPEEINRIVADHCADILFAPDEAATENLKKERIVLSRIVSVGNTSFDACVRNKRLANTNILNTHKLKKNNYILVTIHRAESTENENLRNIVKALNTLSQDNTLVFPIHPRTRKAIEENKIVIDKNIKLIEPQPYLNFIELLSNCRLCITDSGGIQEEAIVFNIPCIIPRDRTEWMRLVDAGKNSLAGTNTESIVEKTRTLLKTEVYERVRSIKIPYANGASEKIINYLKNYDSQNR